MRVRGNFSLVLIAAAAITLLSTPRAFGQAVTGAITGYVTDPSGAAIPNATVTATNAGTKVETKRTTEASGLYLITNLPPGIYTLGVEATGFQRFLQQNVLLNVDSKATVDVTLKLGAVTQEVTVTSAPPMLKTEKTDVAEVIGARRIEALPIPNRNVTELYTLVPGVVKNFFQIGAGENPSEFNATLVNGQFFGNSNYQIDGVDDTAYGFSGFQVIAPNPESVQEMKITTAAYDPEYGSSAGMVAQYVTRSGTNDLHGSLFWFNRNKATFAANPFTEKIPGTGPQGKGFGVAPFNYNQGGFSLGGPIKKNKMFLFGDYQLARTSQGASLTSTVPNDDFRAGDFSALAATNPIFDPTTGDPVTGVGRQQFADPTRATASNPLGLNIIPLNRISPVATNLMNILPRANINQSTSTNFAGGGVKLFNTNQFDVRYDWNISERDKFFARYTYLGTLLDNPPLFGVKAGGTAVGGLSPQTGNTRSQQAALNYTHTFSPSLLTEVRAGTVRFKLSGWQADSLLKTNDKVGIPGINTADRRTGGLAGIDVFGPVGGWAMGILSGVGIPRFDWTTAFQFVNNWTKMSGNHQFRWGADIKRNRFDFQSVNASSRGDFQFAPIITSSPAVSGSGLGMATFLLGMPSHFDRAVYAQVPGERQTRLAFYAQDVWKATPKLTINYGIRYDYFQPVVPRGAGGLVNWDPATGELILAGLGNVSKSANVFSPKTNFSPRLGFSYRLTQKTILRAGFGRSYFGGNYDAVFYHLTSAYPITSQQTITQSNGLQPIFVLDGQTGPPPSTAPALPSSGRLMPPPGQLIKPRPFDWKTEHIDSWNFTVERQMASDFRLSVAYVGNKGTNLAWGGYNPNAANVGRDATDTDLLSRRPMFVKFGEDNAFASLCNCMSSNYHSLQVVGEKRLSYGYSLNSSFTWAKAMDHELGGFGWGDQSTNPYDMKGSYGISTYNRAAVWTISHIWQLPYGRGLRRGSNATGVKKVVLAGWNFNGITTMESGFPVSPNASSGANLLADWGQRPDRVPGVDWMNVPGGQTRDRWYNPAAFTTNFPCCRWGNASRSIIRGPGLSSADWALWKEFTFKTPLNREDTTLQFRWENFNSFNRTNLGLPNSAVDSDSAGRITDLAGAGSGFGVIGPMRRMQFGLRLVW